MYPDDRVLVGVINRKRDLQFLLGENWYRIPRDKLPRGVYTEYLAFFLSGSAARGRDATGIYYYAERSGVELLYRRDILPQEATHARAGEIYYKVSLKNLTARVPAITNPTRRTISFIHTTWDRFINAREVLDLYSTADYFVDRIYHALRDACLRPDRYWSTEYRETGYAPQVRILCENGVVVASTQSADGVDVLLDMAVPEDQILAKIRAQIASKGGPVTINIPHEH